MQECHTGKVKQKMRWKKEIPWSGIIGGRGEVWEEHKTTHTQKLKNNLYSHLQIEKAKASMAVRASNLKTPYA